MNLLAHLGEHLKVVFDGQDQFGAGAQLDHTEFMSAWYDLSRTQIANDPPSDQTGDLPHDQPPVRCLLLFQPNP